MKFACSSQQPSLRKTPRKRRKYCAAASVCAALACTAPRTAPHPAPRTAPHRAAGSWLAAKIPFLSGRPSQTLGSEASSTAVLFTSSGSLYTHGYACKKMGAGRAGRKCTGVAAARPERVRGTAPGP